MILFFSVPGRGVDQSSLQDDLNGYYVRLDEDFARIADAGALRSTNLRPAERLFIREMRKNMAYQTFTRTNSKGVVISEVIRGEKVERPMRDASGERWFRKVSTKKEAYTNLIKDTDRGRYYLVWSRPILKSGDRFVGAVTAKIDLWDSFYEFSNSVFSPFRIKLGSKTLFDHKWNKNTSGTEKPITVQGVDRISVVYSQTGSESVSAAPVKDTTAATFSVADSGNKEVKASNAEQKPKKKGSGVLLFFLGLLIVGIAGASFMLIAWMRRRSFLKRLDDDDTI